MSDTVDAMATAAADVTSMGLKVTGFIIAQNFLMVFATLKGEMNSWLRRRRGWFVGGTVVFAGIYLAIIFILWINAVWILFYSHYGLATVMVIRASNLTFLMLGLGVVSSSALTGLAFWGAGRDADFLATKAAGGRH